MSHTASSPTEEQRQREMDALRAMIDAFDRAINALKQGRDDARKALDRGTT